MALAPTDPPLPRAFGRYQVQAQLGRGAMGVVYSAFDPRLEREVALKTILLDRFEAAARQRLTAQLLNEARLAGGLRHPGIVAVHDAGVHEGIPYIVLEKIAGETLEQRMATAGRLAREAVPVLLQAILEAVACAHAQGITHRDLKPGNIMLEPGGRVRIMDFGIARALHEASPGGGLAGTPRYMAPEQIENRTVDPRADVWALGVIAYELLTGKRPFPQQSFTSLKEAIVGQPHPALAAQAPELDSYWRELIDTALAKEPQRRFLDAGAMLARLHELRGAAATGDAATSASTERGKKEILEFIRKRIERQGDFPATAQYLAEVSLAARSQESSAHKIAEVILKDFALTNRILRMVNSPVYRGPVGQVTTISRAVVLLGVDAILGLTAGLGIFEHFHHRCNVKSLKRLALDSLMTALHARQLAKAAGYPEPEEAFIAGMLYHLGRLIVAFYFSEEFKAIQDLMATGSDETQATRQVMGVSLVEIGAAMAESWRMPDTIKEAMNGLDTHHSGPLRGKIEKLQGVVSYAHELGEASLLADEKMRKAAISRVARQFEGVLEFTPRQQAECIKDSLRHAADLSRELKIELTGLGINTDDEALREHAHAAVIADRELARSLQATGQTAHGRAVESSALPGELQTQAGPGGLPGPAEGFATGSAGAIGTSAVLPAAAAPHEAAAESSIEPRESAARGHARVLTVGGEMVADGEIDESHGGLLERQEVLMRTLLEITSALMGNFQISDVLMMVLEGLYRGLNFRHVVLAMTNPERTQLACRYGLGPRIDEIRGLFRFKLDDRSMMAVKSLTDMREIVIHDAAPEDLACQWPAPLFALLEPQALLLYPMVVQGRAIGLIYLDRAAGQPALSTGDLRDARTLANHAVLAIQQSLARREAR